MPFEPPISTGMPLDTGTRAGGEVLSADINRLDLTALDGGETTISAVTVPFVRTSENFNF
jgi:hypothetical protein